MAQETENTEIKKKSTRTNAKATTAKKANTSKKTSKNSSNSSKATNTKKNPSTGKTTTSAKKNTTSSKKSTNTKKVETTSSKKTSTPKSNIKQEVTIEPIKVEVKEEVVTPVEVVDKNAKKKDADNCTILGMQLPTGTDKVDSDARIKLYMKDSLVFSIIIPILDLLAMLFIKAYKPYPITNSEVINCIITLMIDFILIFILTFSVDYIHGEKIVRKINKGK